MDIETVTAIFRRNMTLLASESVAQRRRARVAPATSRRVSTNAPN